MRILATLVLMALSAGWASAATYYVDSRSGDDGNDGLAAERAWKSLEKVNGHAFGAGDELLFRRGTQYEGQFRANGSGSEDAPVVVGAFGDGARPG